MSGRDRQRKDVACRSEPRSTTARYGRHVRARRREAGGAESNEQTRWRKSAGGDVTGAERPPVGRRRRDAYLRPCEHRAAVRAEIIGAPLAREDAPHPAVTCVVLDDAPPTPKSDGNNTVPRIDRQLRWCERLRALRNSPRPVGRVGAGARQTSSRRAFESRARRTRLVWRCRATAIRARR